MRLFAALLLLLAARGVPAPRLAQLAGSADALHIGSSATGPGGAAGSGAAGAAGAAERSLQQAAPPKRKPLPNFEIGVPAPPKKKFE